MSGSIKWQVYTSDNGTAHAVKLDESNGIAGGFDDITDTNAGLSTIDKGIKMRYVNLLSATGQRRTLKVGKPDNDLMTGVATSVTINEVLYQVTSVVGEKVTRPFGNDTGLNDGTAS